MQIQILYPEPIQPPPDKFIITLDRREALILRDIAKSTKNMYATGGSFFNLLETLEKNLTEGGI